MSGGVGFYGKLPGAGDFVRRRLPSTFIDSWDRHFQRAIETGRRELDGAWSDAWWQGPAWRFMLPAQVCGNDAWTGLIGPATDRLGRAFPMVLAARCTAGDVSGVLGNAAWFDALERVYASAQREAVSVETFDARVAALPDPQRGAMDQAALWRALPWDGGEWQLTTGEGTATGMMLAGAWAQISLRPGAWCLWWRETGSNLLATRGLPRSYALLLEPLSERCGARYGAQATTTLTALVPDLEALGEPSTAMEDTAVLPDVTLHSSRAPLDFALPRDALNDAEPATLLLDGGRLLVLSADDGPAHPRRSASRRIRETACMCGPDLASLRAALFELHARLCISARDVSSAVEENGAALFIRFDGGYAHVLRVGAAAAWLWRDGQLQPLFVEPTAGAGGEFDDLLFGDAWPDSPGIGAAGELDCDETAVRLEHGDRLLLLVTRELAQLPRDCFAQALALPTEEDARLHLARFAGLNTPPATWPFAVVGVDR
jgi:type VI secretion system protein ImpM